jgi:hypothetical protein
MDTDITLKKSHDGRYITYSTNDPLNGFIELVQTVKFFDVAQDKNIFEERSFKLYADVILLQKKVFQFEKIGYLPGRIYQKEFKEDSIPDEYRNKYLASNILELEKHVKYCNETKSFVSIPALPAVTSCGSKIYRFFGYDAYNSEQDVVLEYDLLKSIFNNNVGYNPYKNTESSFNQLKGSNFDFNVQNEINITETNIVKSASNPILEKEIQTTKSPDESSLNNSKISVEANNTESKKTPKDQSSFGYSFRSIIISLVVIGYVGYILIANDRIARMEGSSLWEQFMLLFAAIGIYAIYKAIKKNK